jgi:hypothetical protein
MNRNTDRMLLLFISYVLIATSCAINIQNRRLISPDAISSLKPKEAFLKAHMRDGRVIIFSEWSVLDSVISGKGKLLDSNRHLLGDTLFSIPINSVAIFEANEIRTSGSISSLTIISVSSLIVTAICLANPKACFGSCPTFYVSDGSEILLQAEGFSASVAPSLEARDIDALYRSKAVDRKYTIQMKNEALETHVVRYVRLLAAPRSADERVFHAKDGSFWQCGEIRQPSNCFAAEGDCLGKICNLDGIERFSSCDSSDLGKRESMEIEFPPCSGGRWGLVIGARQSLITTFLFYKALEYMGNSEGEWMATLEKGNKSIRKRFAGIGKAVGGIEVYFQNGEGGWISAGEIYETGPLATDVHLLPFPLTEPGISRVRLKLAQGNWRIDYIALARLDARIEPFKLLPTTVEYRSAVDSTSRSINYDSAVVLTTFPGDEYQFHFKLPDDFENYELFLESKGYYLEWMREDWLAQEDLVLAARMIRNPKGILRDLAPEYKKMEADYEKLFWNSRFARK